jgi:ketosteroid isomerase-like protein
MSQENVDLAYRAIDAVDRGDLGAFLDLMDEEVESVSRIAAIEGGLHGHEGVRRWWRAWFEIFPDYRIEVAAIRDLGEVTLATMRAVGHAVTSELPFQDNFYLATRWRNGKGIWWQVFYDEQEALEASGLTE